MICRDCQEYFSEKLTKKGFKNQCDDCSSKDETIRIIGYNDGSLNKSTNISLYKGSDKTVIKKIMNQKSRTGI